MHGTPHEALVALILSMDRAVLVYLVPIDLLFSTAAVALLSRGRRPLELAAMFAISFVLILALAWVVFHVFLHRPFFMLEIVSFT